MSKRIKSGDMPSTALPRLPSRLANSSIGSRYTLMEKPKTPRSQRFARYTRLGPKHLRPQQTEFRIRTSVAELVMKELEDFDRHIFYQRVYILAKNVLLTVSIESSMDSILSKYMQSKTSVISTEVQLEVECEEAMSNYPREYSDAETEDLSQFRIKQEDFNLLDLKTSKERMSGSLLKLTKADFEVQPKEKRKQELNFFDQIKPRVEEIVRMCDADQLSEDNFSGLFLCMGNSHTLMVLEGTEDTIANFCQEMVNISPEYFEVMRVFMVEDRIEDTYFDQFVFRHSVAMNINEKFPPPTANDDYLMGPQHWIIKEKLHAICRVLSHEIRPSIPELIESIKQPSIVVLPEEKKEPKKRHFIKRKKSPKHKKDPVTQVQQITRSSIKAGSGDLESIKSSIRLSGASGASVRHLSVEEAADEVSQVAVETPTAPQTAVEELSKHEDELETKETSVVKITTFSSTMPEQEEEMSMLEAEEEIEPKEIVSEFALPPATYNRILPEVQRVELVLASKRFYMELEHFVRLSREVPFEADEDSSMWPTQFNYLPLNVFQRMPFDVNLTFGSYNAKKDEEEDSSSEDEKNDNNDEEAHKK